MVHGSKPRLMNRVVDAVVHLCEGKGSTARDVLNYLRQTSKPKPRNLTMQVHRALKYAVNAGLLRHRSGRYKAILKSNPAPRKQSVNENNNPKSAEESSKLNAQPPCEGVNTDDKQNRGKRGKERRKGKRKRNHSSHRRRERRSKSERRQNPRKHVRKIQNPEYKETDEKDRLPRYNSPDRRVKEDFGNASRPSSTRKSSKARQRDRTNYPDPSDSSDCKDKKAKVKRKAPRHRECKYKRGGKFNKRSVSQGRSPEREQSQIKPIINNHKTIDRNNVTDKDAEKHQEPENSGSSSSS